jgi:hypothetical protein
MRRTPRSWVIALLLLLASSVGFSQLQSVRSQTPIRAGAQYVLNFSWASPDCPDPENPNEVTNVIVNIQGSAAKFMSPTSWTWAGVECGGEARSEQVVFSPPCGTPDGTYSWVATASSTNPRMPLASKEQGRGSFAVFTPALSVRIAPGQAQYALGETVTFSVQVISPDGRGVDAIVTVFLDGIVLGDLNAKGGVGGGTIGGFDQTGPHYLTATASAGACFRSGSSPTAAFLVIAPQMVIVTETVTVTEGATEITTETTTQTFITVTEISTTQTETTTRVVTETTTGTTTITVTHSTVTTTETAEDDP